jgi:hypothetical protein
MHKVDALEFQWLPGTLDHLYIYYHSKIVEMKTAMCIIRTLKSKFSQSAYILH